MPSLVSIIIPCYNAAPWLADTLRSALEQNWPHREIIVVDDGSTDASVVVADGFKSRGVRLIQQPNRGASAARNAGFRAATGDYLQFLDADDILSADKISEQMIRLDACGDRLAIASCRWGRFISAIEDAVFVDRAVYRDFDPVEYLLAHTGGGQMMHPAAWLVPRAVAENAGPWDETLTLNDDGEYFARVVLASTKIVHATVGASYYRSQLPSSLSGRKDRRALESLFHSVELIAAHVIARENTARVRQALADYWQRSSYELYPDAADLCRRAQENAISFGGSRVPPPLGPKQRRLARLIGWKLTRQVSRLLPL